MKKNLKIAKEKIAKSGSNGITLIALVVTIVVLLILAAITITAILSEGGIFNTAKRAQTVQDEAAIREKVQIMLADAQLEKLVNNKTLKAYLTEKGYTVTEDTTAGTVTITEDGYNVTMDSSTYQITGMEKAEGTGGGSGDNSGSTDDTPTTEPDNLSETFSVEYTDQPPENNDFQTLDEYSTLYDYMLMEPGYTDLKYFKLINEGNSPVNYEITLSELGENLNPWAAFNLYELDTPPEYIENINNFNNIGNVYSCIDNNGVASVKLGTVAAKTEKIIAIALKMEEGGNEYQNNSLPFTINIKASQPNAETIIISSAANQFMTGMLDLEASWRDTIYGYEWNSSVYANASFYQEETSVNRISIIDLKVENYGTLAFDTVVNLKNFENNTNIENIENNLYFSYNENMNGEIISEPFSHAEEVINNNQLITTLINNSQMEDNKLIEAGAYAQRTFSIVHNSITPVTRYNRI